MVAAVAAGGPASWLCTAEAEAVLLLLFLLLLLLPQLLQHR
jgi:hypothetical protein